MNDAERDAVKRAFNDPTRLGAHPASPPMRLAKASTSSVPARLAPALGHPLEPGEDGAAQRPPRPPRPGARRPTSSTSTAPTTPRCSFLGKVLQKRSQTREDRVVTDEIFADAILAHFDDDEDVEAAEERLERADRPALERRTRTGSTTSPTAAPLPGAEDPARLEALKAELDLSPATPARDARDGAGDRGGRPRLELTARRHASCAARRRARCPRCGRSSSITRCVRVGRRARCSRWSSTPAHYVQTALGPARLPPRARTPRLLHLGRRPLPPGDVHVRALPLPRRPDRSDAMDVRAVGERSRRRRRARPPHVEELAVNELREPCHHWVRTLALPVRAAFSASRSRIARPASGGRLGAVPPRRDAWRCGRTSRSRRRSSSASSARRTARARQAARRGRQGRRRRRRGSASTSVARSSRRPSATTRSPSSRRRIAGYLERRQR